MGRKREDIFTRAARHLDPRVTPEELKQLLDNEHDGCLIWAGSTIPARPVEHGAREIQGRFRLIKVGRRIQKPQPRLRGVGNPARALFAYTRGVEELDRWCMLRHTCGSNLCINPYHHRPIAAFSKFEERHGRIPSNEPPTFNEEEVLALLEDLSLMEFATHADEAEAKRRMHL